MVGNVWEWCLTAAGSPDKAQLWNYAGGPGTMDNAVNGTLRRVVRGGSWLDYQINARAAYRGRAIPDHGGVTIRGFRVVSRPPSP